VKGFWCGRRSSEWCKSFGVVVMSIPLFLVFLVCLAFFIIWVCDSCVCFVCLHLNLFIKHCFLLFMWGFGPGKVKRGWLV